MSESSPHPNENTKTPKIKHLVFSGGAIKGLSYIGCYKALEDLKLLNELETCAGCSIGAIFATLIVLGYTGEELYDFILHFTYQDIRDLNFIRAFSHYGLETGEKITRFLGAMIKRKVGNPQITFGELYKINPIKLVINATNLNSYRVCYFDYLSSPDMPVLLALRMSFSVPFLIKPVVYEKQFYVDGGLLDNLPVSQVPDTPESLAFDLEPVNDLDISYNIQGLESYVYHVFGCVYTEINQIRMSKVHNIQIIKLDTQRINSFSINLAQEQRIFLFNIGYEAVQKYMISVTDQNEPIQTFYASMNQNETTESEVEIVSTEKIDPKVVEKIDAKVVEKVTHELIPELISHKIYGVTGPCPTDTLQQLKIPGPCPTDTLQQLKIPGPAQNVPLQELEIPGPKIDHGTESERNEESDSEISDTADTLDCSKWIEEN